MVDTVRTDAANLALLADNTDGDIGSQDLRDAYVSLAVPAHIRYLDHRLPAETSHADDDFFNSDSDADYTKVAASGTATWEVVNGVYAVEFANQSAQDWACALKAVPAAGVPISIDVRLHNAAMEDNDFVAAGVCFTDGTTATDEIFAVLAGRGGSFGVTSADGDTIGSADWASQQAIPEGGPVTLRLIWESADTFSVAISSTGGRFVDLGTSTFTRTFTPTHMGFAVTAYGNAAPSLVEYDYLRVAEADLSV